MPGYRLTRAAADDLLAIFIESLDQFGAVQADHYHAGLEAAFEFLVEYPRAARLRQESSRRFVSIPTNRIGWFTNSCLTT